LSRCVAETAMRSRSRKGFLMPRNEPPGELCSACAQNIDANEDAINSGTRWYCTERCRRDAEIGGAVQMDLGGE
jgi:hypothetical protein